MNILGIWTVAIATVSVNYKYHLIGIINIIEYTCEL